MVYTFALICALALVGLVYLSAKATRRADSPSGLLCLTWGIVLALYGLSGELFYPVDPATLILLALAPCAFFIGALTATRLPATPSARSTMNTSHLRASVLLWSAILILCLPAYFEHFAGEISDDSQINFIAAIRLASLENEGEKSDFSPLRNLLPFAYALPLVSLLAFEGDRFKGRLITVTAMVLAICYGLLTGSKSVVPALAISFCVVLVAKNNGRLRGSGILPILSAGVLGFLALIRYVNYTFAEDMNEWDLWVAAVQGITSYLCAPVVGLDFFLNNPENYDLSAQSLGRPFYYIANSLLHLIGRPPMVELPSLHLKFFNPGAEFRGVDYNTYTYLVSYIESAGPLTSLSLPFALGVLLSHLHRLATRSNLLALVLYAYVARALALSFNGELLILDVANILKFAVVAWVLTSLTPKLISLILGWGRVPRALPPV